MGFKRLDRTMPSGSLQPIVPVYKLLFTLCSGHELGFRLDNIAGNVNNRDQDKHVYGSKGERVLCSRSLEVSLYWQYDHNSLGDIQYSFLENYVLVWLA